MRVDGRDLGGLMEDLALKEIGTLVSLVERQAPIHLKMQVQGKTPIHLVGLQIVYRQVTPSGNCLHSLEQVLLPGSIGLGVNHDVGSREDSADLSPYSFEDLWNMIKGDTV